MHGFHQFARHAFERVIAQHFDGAIVDFQRIIKSQLVFAKLEFFAAPASRISLARSINSEMI